MATEQPIHMGGSRVPASMAAGAPEDWRSIPIQEREEENFGPEHRAMKAAHSQLGELKKKIAAIGPTVEAILATRMTDDSVLLKGNDFVQGGDSEAVPQAEAPPLAPVDPVKVEADIAKFTQRREEAINAMLACVASIPQPAIRALAEQLTAPIPEFARREFKEREEYGEYMTMITRQTRTLFAEQKKCLEQIKALKKEYLKSKPADEDDE
eukprot:NODE_6797_length_817_cov_87.159942_g6561_i0.p1 GENE.NODE_6797_length_817_cov_87.159942_g6561_i0~~NODE_6797_length_817_cov_87.159942_g6561_i0.p1  ORF type:complete len:211 (-),score=59.13 NODE_6797_length_817_cov_87.159942_g6561_i0:128-760(-)